MTRADLLEAVYRYYPRGVAPDSRGYEDTEEDRRKREVGLRDAAARAQWKAMLGRLAERYPITRLSHPGERELYDGGYWGQIRIPGYTIGFAVSVLGPYYGIRRMGIPSEKEAARDLAREIEATFSGYEEIPPELGYEGVPEVVYGDENAIYTCLFAAAWKWLSHPDFTFIPCDVVKSPEDERRAEVDRPESAPPTPGAEHLVPSMTRSGLLEVVHRFYPRGLRLGGQGYWDTEEHLRRREAGLRGAVEHPKWKAMLHRLAARYPTVDRVCPCAHGIYDGGHAGQIRISGYTIGFAVSALGPYYGIRRIGACGEEEAARNLAREIEATYPGYKEIPPELGNEVVPEVAHNGEDTIYTCLLTTNWKWLSYPGSEARPRHASDSPEDLVKAEAAPDAELESDVHVHDIRE